MTTAAASSFGLPNIEHSPTYYIIVDHFPFVGGRHSESVPSRGRVHLHLRRPMDGGATRNSHPPSLLQPLFSFILSLDVRSRKELAEDWIDDKDGLLVFVRGVNPSSYKCTL